jgi:hypothetical protein
MTSDDDQLPPGGVPTGDPVWDSWHPAQLATLLREVTAPWYVAGGWALDLFRGQQTLSRVHPGHEWLSQL